MTYGGAARHHRKPSGSPGGVEVLKLTHRTKETLPSPETPEKRPKRSAKRGRKERFPRKHFWRDHHRELSAIVRGEVAPVYTPVGNVPIKGRRKRGRGS